MTTFATLIYILFVMAVLGFLLWFYFTPARIAEKGKHPHRIEIFVLNLLFGWTLIGWIVALVWAHKRPA